MKTIRLALAAVAFLFLFSGCEKFNEKRFSTTVYLDFEINKSDTDPVIVDFDDDLTALSNEDLEEVKDKIKSYELVSITYKIWEFYGASDAATFNGSLGIGNVNMTTPGVSYTFNDISLKAGNDNPDQVLMQFNSQEIDKIQQYFLDTDGLRLFLDGNVSEVPVHFKVAVTVNIDAIAEVKEK